MPTSEEIQRMVNRLEARQNISRWANANPTALTLEGEAAAMLRQIADEMDPPSSKPLQRR